MGHYTCRSYCWFFTCIFSLYLLRYSSLSLFTRGFALFGTRLDTTTPSPGKDVFFNLLFRYSNVFLICRKALTTSLPLLFPLAVGPMKMLISFRSSLTCLMGPKFLISMVSIRLRSLFTQTWKVLEAFQVLFYLSKLPHLFIRINQPIGRGIVRVHGIASFQLRQDFLS